MRVSVVVVGGGPAGLAMSRRLAHVGVDHVVLERGEVVNSWRSERWDSLRLLTPNWMTQLPGHGYEGADPDGFMTAAEAVAFFDGYRRRFDPPLLTHVTVLSVRRTATGYAVVTDAGHWDCDAVVAATGASSQPRVPAVAADWPRHIEQVTALEYRRPAQFDRGGQVVVVGASASGVQIADELRRGGHDVTIAVGEHIRVPRVYRGRDIYWWLEAIGQLDERYDEVDDIDRARRHASVQVVGNDEGRDLDLSSLHQGGVRVVGRVMAVAGNTAQCSGGLASIVTNADLKQARLLGRIDEFVSAAGLDDEVGPAITPAPTRLDNVATELDLRRFSTVVWATGYRPTYDWLDPAAFGRPHQVVHDGGVARLPGLYLMGLPFMRRRRSNLIGGMRFDAADLAGHMRGYLDDVARARTIRSGTVGSARPGQQRLARAMDDVLDGTRAAD
jgi:putative flavoprotein involved in K+ transport